MRYLETAAPKGGKVKIQKLLSLLWVPFANHTGLYLVGGKWCKLSVLERIRSEVIRIDGLSCQWRVANRYIVS